MLIQDGGPFSELSISLPWHVPTSTFLFSSALFTLLVGMKNGAAERNLRFLVHGLSLTNDMSTVFPITPGL